MMNASMQLWQHRKISTDFDKKSPLKIPEGSFVINTDKKKAYCGVYSLAQNELTKKCFLIQLV